MKVNFLQRLEQVVSANPARAAVGFMLVSTACFSLMNVCVRMASELLGASLIVNLRNLVTLAMLLPLVAPGRFAILRTTRLKAHIWRSIIGAVGMLSWTYCLTVVPLVHATALSFVAPLMSSILAIWWFKERATSRHAIALGLGVIGVAVILRPDSHDFSWQSLWVILATLSWAVTSLFIKSLSATEPPLRMIFYMNLCMFILTLPFGITGWQMPNLHGWLLISGISFFSIAMHFTMVRAFALAPIVTVMPLDFMRLVYTSILAYLIFGEVAPASTWLGAAIIIGSIVWFSRRGKAPPLPESEC